MIFQNRNYLKVRRIRRGARSAKRHRRRESRSRPCGSGGKEIPRELQRGLSTTRGYSVGNGSNPLLTNFSLQNAQCIHCLAAARTGIVIADGFEDRQITFAGSKKQIVFHAMLAGV